MTNRNGVALKRTRIEFKLSETALGINLGTKSRSITDISRFVDSLREHITFLVRTVQVKIILLNRIVSYSFGNRPTFSALLYAFLKGFF